MVLEFNIPTKPTCIQPICAVLDEVQVAEVAAIEEILVLWLVTEGVDGE